MTPISETMGVKISFYILVTCITLIGVFTMYDFIKYNFLNENLLNKNNNNFSELNETLQYINTYQNINNNTINYSVNYDSMDMNLEDI